MTTTFQGLVTYLGYFLAFWNEIVNYLFYWPGGTAQMWFERETLNPVSSTSGQWTLNDYANLPSLTTKGSDFVAAIMTIAHNGLVALAQLSTLLPANAL